MKIEDKVLAFLQDQRLEATKSYVVEGQRFRSLDDEDLRVAWSGASRHYASDPSNKASRKRWEELQAGETRRTLA